MVVAYALVVPANIAAKRVHREIIYFIEKKDRG
jgi:hypothetical protein